MSSENQHFEEVFYSKPYWLSLKVFYIQFAQISVLLRNGDDDDDV